MVVLISCGRNFCPRNLFLINADSNNYLRFPPRLRICFLTQWNFFLFCISALQSYQYQQRVCISNQQKRCSFPSHHEQGMTEVKFVPPNVHKLVNNALKSRCICCQIFKAYMTFADVRYYWVEAWLTILTSLANTQLETKTGGQTIFLRPV